VLKRRAAQQELRPPGVSLHNHKKHKILPSPPERGRGAGGEEGSPPYQPAPDSRPIPASVGGRGSCRAPLSAQTTRGSAGASPSRRVPQSRHNSVSNRCHVAAPCKLRTAHRLPHGRGSWLTAWSMGAHVETRGTFTPHPRPLVSGDMDLFSSAGRQRWYDYLIPVCSRN
jgi:hypothetical protein